MKLYRYYDTLVDTSTLGQLFWEYGVVLDEFEIEKETLCGYWIISHDDKRKWVSKTGKKRYAYPTKELAKNSFIRRKQMQIKYAKITIMRAETVVGIIKKTEV